MSKVRRVALTGGGGFLGHEVGHQLETAGYDVVRLRRGSSDVAMWQSQCATVDAVVHLAAPTAGIDEDAIAEALSATRRLFDALPDRPVRVVFAGSMALFHAPESATSISETTETWEGAALELQDRYTQMKSRQEELMRTLCAERRCALTIVRPTNVWSALRWQQVCVGPKAGPLWFVVKPRRRLRLTHVENGARAFVAALEPATPSALLREVNVDDNADVTAWHYATRIINPREHRYLPLPLPGWLFAWTAALTGAAMTVLMPKRRLPGLLIPDRREARFGSFTVDTRAAQSAIRWQPELGVYRSDR